MALAASGYDVALVASRSFESARRLAGRIKGCSAVNDPQAVVDGSDLIFVTTPDDAIAPVVESLRWRRSVSVVHTSGAEPASVLSSAAEQGAAIGSLHPLQTFASLDAPPAMDGIVYAVEADGELRDLLMRLVSDLGGRTVELRPEDRALYHASAVLVSNFNVTLMKLASDLWLRFGWERRDAVRALLPLLEGTVKNIEALGVPAALTGPVARGDATTVERHLEALAAAAPEVADIYRALSEQTILVALAKGTLTEAGATALRAALEPSQEARV
jgi:predicted short-subunit dehydrogenase-like oxidoreductase (DUF2520 family)